MNTRDGWMAWVPLVLALASGVGLLVSDEYTEAARAEVAGFDALARGMFGGLAAKPVPEARVDAASQQVALR